MNQCKPWDHGPLRVTEDGRYLRNGDTPFFYLGDTAWLLCQVCDEAQARLYLTNRRDKGFTVIQAVLIHRLPGMAATNQAEVEKDATEPAYWAFVDSVVRMAEELGLYMALLPAWGSVVKEGRLEREQMETYVTFLARRYAAAPNVIWLLGGDIRGDSHHDLYCLEGRLFKQLNPDKLIGYHPFGRTSSSLWFHQEPWLDFNMFQSGHRRYDQTQLDAWDDAAPGEGCFGEDNWRYVESDRARVPAKPTLDGEPSYEQIPQGLHDPSEPYWNSADVRRYAYWSVFAGAAGHTYGHNAVMQFYRDRSSPGAFGVRELWSDAVHHPGAAQMIHLKRLMESVGFENGRPAQELLCGDAGERYDRVSVFAGDSFILAYTFTGREITLDLSPYAGQGLSAYWMDPVTGLRSYLRAVPGKKEERFAPPSREDGSDTVLVIV